MTEKPAATSSSATTTNVSTSAPSQSSSSSQSANADLAVQIDNSQTRMIHLEADELDEKAAAALADGDPPIKAEFDQVRQMWALTRAPTS